MDATWIKVPAPSAVQTPAPADPATPARTTIPAAAPIGVSTENKAIKMK